MKSPQEIDKEFKSRFADLVKQYGDHYSIPSAELYRISEIARAEHVARICSERNMGSLPSVLRLYGVSDQAISQIAGEAPIVERKQKRPDKNKIIFDWCDANPGKETTVYEVADVAGISYSAANQVVKSRIDYFKKVKKGLYIIRNPKLERAEEKK